MLNKTTGVLAAFRHTPQVIRKLGEPPNFPTDEDYLGAHYRLACIR